MDKYLEEITCPICLEIPKHKIYQCKNGHIICKVCITNLAICPQCRVTFDTDNIRCRVLENLLDKQVFDCKFKNEGCKERVTRQEISAHTESCKFGEIQVKFCSRFGITCDFVMSSNRMPEFFEHLQQHKIISCSKEANDFVIEQLDQINCNENCIWGPHFITPDFPSNVTYFSICYFNSLDKTVSLICFKINRKDDPQITEDVCAEFIIKASNSAERPDIVWNTTPFDIKYTGVSQMSPRYPLKVLVDHYAVNNELHVSFALLQNHSTGISENTGSVIKLHPHNFA